MQIIILTKQNHFSLLLFLLIIIITIFNIDCQWDNNNQLNNSTKSDLNNEIYPSSTANLNEFIDTTNKTRKQILEMYLGPQKKPLPFVIFMSTIYSIILICGLLGNISTCLVIIFNKNMHSTTNYYLFSLAVSDVLSLLSGKNID
jgi:hypothetical protein